MKNEAEKLEVFNPISEEKRSLLRYLFPEVFTEGDRVDFERLKLTLGEAVEIGKERFGLNWPGKADCYRTIQQPSVGTLLPSPDDSVNFDEAANVIIEGDNLEVLKLLQKSYLGKVKMIYIDPPYNTGKDFIYPDNYTESLDTYLRFSGQVDDEGRKYSSNPETDGRFHSKWLTMMYPRLFLARNLLREDGVIFISIDDHELENLRKITNEIFGEENYIATLVWEKGRKNDARRFSVGHEYLLGFAKNLSLIEEILPPWREPKEGVTEIVDEYKRLKTIHGSDHSAISNGLVAFYQALPEGHPSKKYSRSRFVDKRGIWRDNNISWPGGGGPRYDLLHPRTKKPCKVPDDGWRFIETTMKQKVRDEYVEFREDHTKSPFLKSYLYVDGQELPDDEDAGEKLQVMGSVFYRHSQPANDIMKELFGEKIFENPKDHHIIARLIRYCTNPGDIVLDFFAGSGTTAHSVLELSTKGVGERNYILVQLPEPTGRTDFPTISEIARERVRRVLKKLDATDVQTQLDLGGGQISSSMKGFKAFKLGSSNFRSWESDLERNVDKLQAELKIHVSNVQRGRAAEDLLYEILLRSGFDLTSKIERISLHGTTVFSVADGLLFVCLEKVLSKELITTMADRRPSRIVCLDQGFEGNDQLKTNTVETMRAKSITFKTV